VHGVGGEAEGDPFVGVGDSGRHPPQMNGIPYYLAALLPSSWIMCFKNSP
jgi:hypothetical protein